jgi:hypothetical protein
MKRKTISNISEYRLGWIMAMKDIHSHSEIENLHYVINYHTADYSAGYRDALMHFAGKSVREEAYTEGLVEAYRGFWGQRNFSHLER